MKKYFIVLFLFLSLIVSTQKVQASYTVPPANLLAGAAGGDGPIVASCVITSMTLSPSIIAYGSNAVLSWSVSGGCSNITLNNISVGNITSDIKTIGPLTQSVSYTLSATGKNGTTTKSVSVSVIPKTPPQDPTCTATVPPKIAVTLPNGGETYEAGKQITVNWNSCNITSKTVSISLYDGVRFQPTFPLATSVTNDGSDMVTLPTIAQYPAMKYGKNFQILIANSDSSVSDYSDSTFTITQPVIQKNITVTSPKTGDTFKRGQQITVSWTSTGVDASAVASVSLLLSGNPVNGHTVTTTLISKGSLVYTIPTDISVDTAYKILIGVEDDTHTQYVVSGTSDLFVVKSDSNNTPADMTPRIAYWSGKINQHIDVNGQWVTDSDGTSMSTIDKLVYCKKWYPSTISVVDYKTETISTWQGSGNTGGPYTASVVTTQCISGNPSQTITLQSPYAGQAFQIGGTMQVSWTTSNVPTGNAVWLQLHADGSSATIAPITLGINDGNESVVLPTTSSQNYSALTPGVYRVTISTLGTDGVTPVVSDASTTITLVGNNTSYYPDGCTSLTGYSTTTGMPCSGTTYQQSSGQFLSGCSSYLGYSTTTGQSCSGGSSSNTNTNTYTGGNGTINYFGTTIPSSWTHVVGSDSTNSTTTGSTQDCTVPVFTKTLRLGQSGDQVQTLQAILNDQGYLSDNFVTGTFDLATRTALKAFQRANGVLVTGYTGSTSRAKLNAITTQQCLGQ